MSNITHAEEEKKLSAKTEQFLGYLMRSGYLADPKIQDPKARAKKKEKNQKTYHNTRMLLEHYREMLWAMESVPAELKAELDLPLEELDALISKLDLEMSMENRRTESRLQTILKSRVLLDRINEAIAFLRTKPSEGELLYKIIYETYIADKKDSIFDVMDELNLSRARYYDLRKKAINMIGMKLWNAPDTNFEVWMELLSLFDT